MISHPWLVVYQPGGVGPVITVLAGPEGASVDAFALVIADVVKHVGNAHMIPVERVLSLVMAELSNPTSAAKRMTDD